MDDETDTTMDEEFALEQYRFWSERWEWNDTQRFDVELSVLDFLVHDGVPLDERFRAWIRAAAADGVAQTDKIRRIADAVAYVVERWNEEGRRRPFSVPSGRHRMDTVPVCGAPRRNATAFKGNRVASYLL